MMSKKTVGHGDHHYLQQDLVIAAVPFNRMMDQLNASPLLVDGQTKKRFQKAQKFCIHQHKTGFQGLTFLLELNMQHVLHFLPHLTLHVLLLEVPVKRPPNQLG